MSPEEHIAELIAEAQRKGELPRSLGPRQLQLLTKSLARYSDQVDERIQEHILEDFNAHLKAGQSGITPPTELNRGIVADLGLYVGSPEVADIIRNSLDITSEVAAGGGRFLNQLQSIDEYPCLELKRMFPRDVPRGFERGPKGTLIPVPDDDWESRWTAAGGEIYEGRMIATVDDPVWQALGDGAGDHDDCLGNPFPPFAFRSGYMTFNVPRSEAIALGVIDADDKVEAPKIDYGNLFNFN